MCHYFCWWLPFYDTTKPICRERRILVYKKVEIAIGRIQKKIKHIPSEKFYCLACCFLWEFSAHLTLEYYVSWVLYALLEQSIVLIWAEVVYPNTKKTPFYWTNIIRNKTSVSVVCDEILKWIQPTRVWEIGCCFVLSLSLCFRQNNITKVYT